MSHNLYTINSISSQSLEETYKKYQHIAKGILQRLNINPYEENLCTMLGDCQPGNNLDVVTHWVFDTNPHLLSFGREEIDRYTDALNHEILAFYEMYW